MSEEVAHHEEGVQWPRLNLPDNQACLDLLSNRGGGLADGVFQLLDNATRLNAREQGQGGGQLEKEYFYAVHAEHLRSRDYLSKPPRRHKEDGFVVKHYAGDVVYLSAPASAKERHRVRKALGRKMGRILDAPHDTRPPSSWIEKNDVKPIPDPLMDLLLESNDTFTLAVVSGIYLPDEPPKPIPPPPTTHEFALAQEEEAAAVAARHSTAAAAASVAAANAKGGAAAGAAGAALDPASAVAGGGPLVDIGNSLVAVGNGRVVASAVSLSAADALPIAAATPFIAGPILGPDGQPVEGPIGGGAVAAAASLYDMEHPADVVEAAIPLDASAGWMKSTLSREVRFGVDTLIVELARANLRYVRCLKPNHLFRPDEISPRLLLQQLRHSASMEAVEVMRSAFPVRIPYADVYGKFKDTLPSELLELGLLEYVVRVLAVACEMPVGSYKLGSTRLFVRARCATRLLQLVDVGKASPAPSTAFSEALQAMLETSQPGGSREQAAMTILAACQRRLDRRRKEKRKGLPGSVKEKRVKAEARDRRRSHRQAGMDRALERTALAVYKQQSAGGAEAESLDSFRSGAGSSRRHHRPPSQRSRLNPANFKAFGRSLSAVTEGAADADEPPPPDRDDQTGVLSVRLGASTSRLLASRLHFLLQGAGTASVPCYVEVQCGRGGRKRTAQVEVAATGEEADAPQPDFEGLELHFKGALSDFLLSGITVRVFDARSRSGMGMHDLLGECKVQPRTGLLPLRDDPDLASVDVSEPETYRPEAYATSQMRFDEERLVTGATDLDIALGATGGDNLKEAEGGLSFGVHWDPTPPVMPERLRPIRLPENNREGEGVLRIHLRSADDLRPPPLLAPPAAGEAGDGGEASGEGGGEGGGEAAAPAAAPAAAAVRERQIYVRMSAGGRTEESRLVGGLWPRFREDLLFPGVLSSFLTTNLLLEVFDKAGSTATDEEGAAAPALAEEAAAAAPAPAVEAAVPAVTASDPLANAVDALAAMEADGAAVMAAVSGEGAEGLGGAPAATPVTAAPAAPAPPNRAARRGSVVNAPGEKAYHASGEGELLGWVLLDLSRSVLHAVHGREVHAHERLLGGRPRLGGEPPPAVGALAAAPAAAPAAAAVAAAAAAPVAAPAAAPAAVADGAVVVAQGGDAEASLGFINLDLAWIADAAESEALLSHRSDETVYEWQGVRGEEADGEAEALDPLQAYLRKMATDEPMITFEVTLKRASVNGSLGVQIEPYQGHPTVCNIVEGGPAHRDGTLHLGDVIIAVEGKPVHTMDTLIEAIVGATSPSVRLAVVRPPLHKLKTAVVYLAVSAGDDERRHDDEYEPFELSVLSNRQLIFEQLDKPFTYGQVHLQLARSLQLIKHGAYNLCLRLNLDEQLTHMHHIEWYADTIQELRDWQALLRTLMVADNDAETPARAHWFVMHIAGERHAHKRWVKLEAHATKGGPAGQGAEGGGEATSNLVLSCFDIEHNENVVPAHASLNLRVAQRVRLLDAREVEVLLKGGQRHGRHGGAKEVVRIEVNVPIDHAAHQPLGLDFYPEDDYSDDGGLTIKGARAGSACLPFFGGKGGKGGKLRNGDRLIELDGNELFDLMDFHDVYAYMAETKKKAHTLLVERLEEVPMPSHGRAIEIVTKQQRWVLFPCAKGTDKVLSDEGARRVADEWHGVLREAQTQSAQRKLDEQSGQVSDVALQQLHVELWDVDHEWLPYYLVLYKIKGLCFFEKRGAAAYEREQAEAAPSGGAPSSSSKGGGGGGIEAAVAAGGVAHMYDIPLERISYASHAMGPDYYDGVINVELDDGEQERIRVGGLNASMHSLLSAINLYKRGQASADPKRRQSVVMRNEFAEAARLEEEQRRRQAEEEQQAEQARLQDEAEAAAREVEEAEAAVADASRSKGLFGGLGRMGKTRNAPKAEQEAAAPGGGEAVHAASAAPKSKAAKLAALFEEKSAAAGQGAPSVGPVAAAASSAAGGAAKERKAWVQRKPMFGRRPDAQAPTAAEPAGDRPGGAA